MEGVFSSELNLHSRTRTGIPAGLAQANMLSKGGKSGFVQSLPGFVLFCISLSARTLNVDDILSIRTLQNVVISPDGSRIAFVVNEPSDDEHSKDPPNTDLYIAPVNGVVPKRLTSNQGRDSDPQWAPDSAA